MATRIMFFMRVESRYLSRVRPMKRLKMKEFTTIFFFIWLRFWCMWIFLEKPLRTSKWIFSVLRVKDKPKTTKAASISDHSGGGCDHLIILLQVVLRNVIEFYLFDACIVFRSSNRISKEIKKIIWRRWWREMLEN